MAWTATLINKYAQAEGSVRLVVQYTSGGTTVAKEYTFFGEFDPEVVVKNEIANLDNLKTRYISLTENNVINPSSVISTPTAKDLFFIGVGRLGTYQNLINLGVVSSVLSNYTTLKASVAGAFNATYI